MKKPSVRWGDSIPRSNRARYCDEVIFSKNMWQAILHFIKLNIEGKGIDADMFGPEWMSRRGQKANFWRMIRIKPDPIYWIKIIDRMFEDPWVRKYRFYEIIHILEGATLFSPDPPKPEIVIDEQSIIRETAIRIGKNEGEPNPDLNKYFKEDGRPTDEAMKLAGLDGNFRFKKVYILKNYKNGQEVCNEKKSNSHEGIKEE